MNDDPFYIRLLDKLGVNTTRLRWRLYRVQQKGQQIGADKGLPAWLQWLRYPHKICRRCGAVNDRADRVCHRCEGRLPTMMGYRLARLAGIVVPEAAPATMMVFLTVMLAVYSVTILIDGFAIMMHSTGALYLLGAFTHFDPPLGPGWWRMLSFSLIHGGIIHVAFNFYALSQIGPIIESQLGPRRMLVMVTATQFAAALATFVWYTVVSGGRPFVTVGASGWLCGLLGFGVVFFRDRGQGPSPYRQPLIQWCIYVILFGLVIGANNAAHIGGMASGMAVARLTDSSARHESATAKRLWDGAFWVCLALWLFTVFSMIVFAVTHWSEFAQT